MEIVERHVLVLRPRQPFLDWINACDPEDEPSKDAEDATAYLIPAFDQDSDQEEFLRSHYLEFFEEELAAWYQDEAMWPTPRTWDVFDKWVSREVSSLVFDAAAAVFPFLPGPDLASNSDEAELVINWSAVEKCSLALLYLTVHDGSQVWKGHDWEVLNRLHAKGLISNPATKAKSVSLTPEGEHVAAAAFTRLFTFGK